ncbi:DedA family protein [Inhella gelatinilytica]|uniref:DedA family protein n=1 Tax=Inhella gelatinilytica TaxID=2795030 RepID=A0A931NDF2_9BURK|nr:DedA family protein [Inhella gelatinilytica]MBH9553022.1 DedA family protein [Inhella gelatinilytica]
MELLALLIDFVLHVDRHIAAFVGAYGPWVYALLFAIVFVETGLVVMPFLPGDSLLFIAGALCAAGAMNFSVTVGVLLAAAWLGNQTNYCIGRWVGPRVFQWEDSRLFNRKAFDSAHAFYEKYGGITIIVARFLPFLRTFAPFVAGVAAMSHRKFTAFDLFGGAFWILSLTSLGYAFGNVPVVKENMEKVIWAMILIPGVLALLGAWRAKRRAALAS